VFRINYRDDQKIRIQSSFIKRLELEHLENVVESLNIVPDFGFPVLLYDEEFKGWELFRDHIQNSDKFERVNNYIDSKKYKIEMELKQKQSEMEKAKQAKK
jgi:hypothetical protein